MQKWKCSKCRKFVSVEKIVREYAFYDNEWYRENFCPMCGTLIFKVKLTT